MILWAIGLRGVGIALAIMLGILIIKKMRTWQDPALKWLLVGLSIGPVMLLAWNSAYRLLVESYIAPVDRIVWLGNIQFRYFYDILNNMLDLLCAGAIMIGVAKLYRNVHQRVRLITPREFDCGDPRN